MTGFIRIVFVVVLFQVLQAERYTTKWDDIDVDEILASKRLLKNYQNCLMDRGTCTPDGAELKKNLPDALKTDCAKCSEKQKSKTEKVVDYMIEHEPEWWAELQKKYDPSGVYYNTKVLPRLKSKGKNPVKMS